MFHEGNQNEFYVTFRQALRTILWISLPVAAIAFFTRGYVVSFISNIGNNDANGTIASVLGALCVAIFARSVFHIAARGFYACQDTKTPFIISIIAIGLTIGLSVLFYKIGWGVDGLGLAQSIGAVVEIIILLGFSQFSYGKMSFGGLVSVGSFGFTSNSQVSRCQF